MPGECCGESSCSCDCGNIPENRMCVVCSPAMGFDVERVKELVKDPKYVCGCCGRVARSKENLCSPEPL